MREKRSAEAAPTAGAYLAPVDMPVQTYQWNKRAVVEEPAGDAASGPQGDAAYGAVAVAVAAPEAPPVTAAPPPPPMPAQTWTSPAPTPVARVTAKDDPRYGGIALACIVALGIPIGLTFAVEGMRWQHGSGANTTLVALVTASILVGSCLIGLLSSEFGNQRSVVRGLAAASLSGVMAVLLGVLVDAHPGKFGFRLGTGALVVLVGPVLAFVVGSMVGSRR